MAKEYITKILPVATAVWPKVNEVDVFTPKKGEPKRRYTINLKFNDEDHRAVDKWLADVAAKRPDEVGRNINSPWKKDKKSGELTLFAFSGEKNKPILVDAKNRQLPVDVVLGGGSKVRVDVTANPYDGFGGGINLYINAIQVIELKEGGRRGANFDAVDGGYEAPAYGKPSTRFDDHTSSDNHTSSDDGDMDDDIPF